ncbi:LuxR C-terminal-related transcriptional regulator [Arthrobacter sp. H35-D1]|uniref:helix-turn-helix transcriptional regulator n=1 Tax=Arthrobacter sp. H35-D1 TaxID=3046202 RepID=UPI0024BB6712|nr:LuxR C-terminal-related transcriptional regulator [Arthrobacter sp. H35-D1]MDJ0312304.1 LuxR C-terminal-related transcriptional regulator [Arthrobacter sp. H35-D1]
MRNSVSMQWIVSGRESVVAEIVEALKPQGEGDGTEGAGKSVVLTGESGIGKSHLAAGAVKRLQPDLHVIRLHTSAHTSKEPYGALAVFLWEEGRGNANNPVQVLAATRRRLECMAEGKAVCLYVDNANDLDGRSAVILAQLARVGAVRLLLTCAASRFLPRELSDLVKDGSARQLAVEPLSFLEAINALEARLGGSLSRLAGRRLWNASGGDPFYLGVLAEDMQKSGALVSGDGVWCLDESVEEDERIPARLFAKQLGRLSSAEARTLEIVALAGGIPINTLLALVEGDEIDALEQKGLLRIDTGHIVRTGSPLLARVVRSRVPAGRSRDLWEAVNLHLPRAQESSPAAVGMAVWSLECGQPAGDGVALAAAARTENNRMRPRQALWLLASQDPGVKLTSVTVEQVRSHMILGEVSAVHDVLRSFYCSTHEEPTLDSWVELQLAETSMLVTSRETWQEADANLDKVRTELYPDPQDRGIVPTGAGIGPLRSQLALAGVGAAWWSGNYSSVLDELNHCMLAETQHAGSNALMLGGQLSLATAAAGHIDKALELADGLTAALDQVDAAPAGTEQVRELLFFTYLIAGRLDAAEESARGFHGRSMAQEVAVHGTVFADLALPILAAARGHGEHCLSLLRPELAQLRLKDQCGALALALSAAAYASALSGDVDSCRRYLAELGGCGAAAPWLVERMGRHFELAARGMSGDRDGSVTQLLSLSEADRDSGRNHWEMVSLGLALRLGAVGVAGKLLAATEQFVDGPCSFYRALAEGTLKGDAGLLALAAELAADAGNDAAVVDAAEMGLALGTLDLYQRRSLAARLETSRRNMDISSLRAGDKQPLTARQLEIAKLAASGASNKEIAISLHVSIRTVEGHLYQIFGKLRISDRSDLAVVLEQVVGDRS